MALLKKLGLPVSMDNLSEGELLSMEHVVVKELQEHGIVDNGVNQIGHVCESLLDIIYEAEAADK